MFFWHFLQKKGWPYDDEDVIGLQPILDIPEVLEPFTYKTVQALEHLAEAEERQREGT